MKRKKMIVGFAVGFVILLSVILLSGDQGIFAFYQSFRRMETLRNELEHSHRTIDSLKVEIERLKSDTQYIERIAREKYGMAKNGEKLYKFIEEK